ncbi:hypothetical protein EJ04DRAFT_591134 [Polyplosphaeria fusca]|uniref:C2H2-type domain-containing protein n=1 Tax=Polyplosphaeria fusca TaxID=682080 RepID=A0A9P4QMW0_9PLEO|nr:hypothetical protein EJ04DRAFT_591134 [Polyplosphaeria fusca]
MHASITGMIETQVPIHAKARDHRLDKEDDQQDHNAGHPDGDAPGSSRKLSGKDLDKKFECPHEGCGKSYSRAEHLHRHQLNHNPKQIYHCDFPDCHRSFVRQDLCARHKERHTARGSQLLRKHTLTPVVTTAMARKKGSPMKSMTRTPTSHDQENQSDNGTSGQTPMNGVKATLQLNTRMNGVSDAMLDHTPSCPILMFGGESYNRSPFAMADDFAAWLFNDSSFGPGASPMGYPSGSGVTSGAGASYQIGLQAPHFQYDLSGVGLYTTPAPPSHPMAVNSILETTLSGSVLSEDKRKDLLDLIIGRFNETDYAPVKIQKEEILKGNKEDDRHILSLHMMQAYISSYWVHFHPQLPIMHRPTFKSSTCPDLLLLAIMCLGASCLEKRYRYERTQACAALGDFLAWHLRWEIFMDADFRPPAKLWIFQALLLLEVFEKMYSTRPLHERAHIHHATTLTLMRRGSSLIGRSALDSPPSIKDGKGGINGAHGSTTSPDEWWTHWITNEATRRATFAAFVMDSIHATMFGHRVAIAAYEMRLPLPCDEALWSATSSAEVGGIESSLHSNGVKQTTFLEGLKKTLDGQTVRTNSFGRIILMAGLLNVSWHMNQRDLQLSSLGVSQTLTGREKWQNSITRAFEHWRQDFNTSLSWSSENSNSNGSNGMDDYIVESRTVLHHLAHMTMHVDIVDCQIYAGATRLLGRLITTQDYNGACRRMKEQWAPTARARDATFYALRFLSKVISDEHSHSTGKEYSARDDLLLDRPWALYLATIIVWSYGYALDGPLKVPYQLSNHEDKMKDMVGYLNRVGGVPNPDDLAKVTDRNACVGMLLLMRDMFKKTRWELLHEASNLLTKCVEMLIPGAGSTM